MTQKKTSKFLGIVQFFNHFNYFKLLLITLLFQIHFKEDCTSLCTSLCSPHVQLIDDDFIPFFSVFFFFCNFFIKKDFWAIPLREKCPCSELFWSAFFECGKNANSVRMRKNADQNNSEYGHFLLSVLLYFGNFLCKLSTSLAITVKIPFKPLPVRNSSVFEAILKDLFPQ